MLLDWGFFLQCGLRYWPHTWSHYVVAESRVYKMPYIQWRSRKTRDCWRSVLWCTWLGCCTVSACQHQMMWYGQLPQTVASDSDVIDLPACRNGTSGSLQFPRFHFISNLQILGSHHFVVLEQVRAEFTKRAIFEDICDFNKKLNVRQNLSVPTCSVTSIKLSIQMTTVGYTL